MVKVFPYKAKNNFVVYSGIKNQSCSIEKLLIKKIYQIFLKLFEFAINLTAIQVHGYKVEKKCYDLIL